MCLSDFQRFEDIPEDKPLIGYRNWRLTVKTSKLMSAARDYIWTPKAIEGPHEVVEEDSGIYAYNYNNYYYNFNYYNYYNNFNYYNNYYYNFNYNNNYHYNIAGIIHQFERIAIHSKGQRSEFAKIKTFFTIRKSDAKGPEKFLTWIDKFNNQIIELAKQFNAETIHWQDFVNSQK